MTAGYIGNGHAGLRSFGQDGHLLIERIPTPALDAGQNFDSFRGVGHRRITRRKPRSSLRNYVRFKWGPLQWTTIDTLVGKLDEHLRSVRAKGSRSNRKGAGA